MGPTHYQVPLGRRRWGAGAGGGRRGRAAGALTENSIESTSSVASRGVAWRGVAWTHSGMLSIVMCPTQEHGVENLWGLTGCWMPRLSPRRPEQSACKVGSRHTGVCPGCLTHRR